MAATAEIIGVLGGLVTNSAILPQLYKCYRTRSTRDLSWAMFATYYLGVTLMLTYGLLIAEPAVVLSTCYSLLTNTVLVAMKWYFETYAATAAAPHAPHAPPAPPDPLVAPIPAAAPTPSFDIPLLPVPEDALPPPQTTA